MPTSVNSRLLQSNANNETSSSVLSRIASIFNFGVCSPESLKSLYGSYLYLMTGIQSNWKAARGLRAPFKDWNNEAKALRETPSFVLCSQQVQQGLQDP